MASSRPTRKVRAASGGGGVGGALGIIAVWLIERGGVDLPGPVEAAVLVLVAAACAFVAGYCAAPAPGDVPVEG